MAQPNFGSLPRAKSPLGVGSEMTLARRPLRIAHKNSIEGIQPGPQLHAFKADLGHGSHVKSLAAPTPSKIPEVP